MEVGKSHRRRKGRAEQRFQDTGKGLPSVLLRDVRSPSHSGSRRRGLRPWFVSVLVLRKVSLPSLGLGLLGSSFRLHPGLYSVFFR